MRRGRKEEKKTRRILHKAAALFFIFLFPIVITMCGGGGGSSSYFISGRITTSNGAGLPGVTVILSGVYAGCSGSTSTTTDANGYYRFTTDFLYSGGGTLTPSLQGYAFTPEYRSISSLGNANFPGQDFTAMPLHSIFGTVTLQGAGLAGITMTLIGGVSTFTALTGVSGGYSFGGLVNGTYTVTPSSTAGYVFTPPSRTVTFDVDADTTSRDFTAACASGYSILGSIVLAGGSGLPGVTVEIAGTDQNTPPQYATTDINGLYHSSCVQNGSYAITPRYDAGYVISPASRAVTVNNADVTGQDFAISSAYAVSGTVTAPDGAPLPGAMVTISGTASSLSVTTDARGQYALHGLLNGTYTLVPSTDCPSYTFTPAVRTVMITNGDAGGQDFASAYASAATYSVSGRIIDAGGSGIGGVSIDLLGAAPSSLATDENGYYGFTGLRNGLYTIKPSSGSYAYLPDRRAVSVCNGDLTARDFTAVTTWVRTYAGTIASIRQTPDNGYIAIGSIYVAGGDGTAYPDAWVAKLDANGEILWQKSYGGPMFDYGQSISPTPDGGYIAGVGTSSFGAGGQNIWVLKLDAQGNILWQQTYGGTDDGIGSIEPTSDGGYVVAGATYSFGAGNADPWVFKLDSKGAVQWQKYYGSAYYSGASAVRQTADGGYIVAGGTYSFGAGGSDAWILKLDAGGNVLWQKTYGGAASEWFTSVRQTSDGGYIAAGDASSFGAGSTDVWVVKLDADGNVLWQKAYGGTGADTANEVRQTADGGYIVAGNYLIKLDADGNVLWQKAYSGVEMNSVLQTADGGYLAAGGYSILKLDAEGGLDLCAIGSNANLTTTSTSAAPAVSTAATCTTDAAATATSITPADVAAGATQVCPAQ